MLLGCNYSSQLIELAQEGKVNVDYIKLGLYEIYEGSFDISRSISSVLVHGFGFDERASMRPSLLDDINWQDVNRNIKKFNSPHIGIHLFAHQDDWEETPTEADIIERMISVLSKWKDSIDVPLLVENMIWKPYYKERGLFPCYVEADLISKVCDVVNIELLLDIAHAKVTAFYRNESIFSYLERLPLEKVKEIHTVGTMMTQEHVLKDGHLEMQEEDFEILDWLLHRTNPDVITLEYGGPGEIFSWRSDKSALERQLNRLMEICKRY